MLSAKERLSVTYGIATNERPARTISRLDAAAWRIRELRLRGRSDLAVIQAANGSFLLARLRPDKEGQLRAAAVLRKIV
jgi:hypothetical protein